MAAAGASPVRVRRLSAWLPGALAAAAVAVAVCLPAVCASRQPTCSDASRAYGRIGFSPIDVPQHAILGDNSKICASGYTCCTSPMEANLTRKARQWFDQRLVRITQPSRDTLVTRTVKLNDFFLQLIQRAQDDLNEMFVKAYGLQYIANVGVFRELFQNLRRFFQPGAEANVPEAVRRFFMDIFARMFAMLNPEYSFDDAYLLCVAAQVGTLRPFGDIPDTMARNIKQAFIAAKMFVQGLAVGRDVALKAPTVEPNADCFRALTRLLYCHQCRADGMPSGASTAASAASDPRPCHEYCVNVARGCLAQHYELSDSWDRYLDAMDELGTRIEGPGAFNIEAILTPLKDLISTAIMEYHDNNRDITQKIFMSKGCGAPKTGRQPRSAASAAFERAALDATSRAARSSRLSLPTARSNSRQQQQQQQSTTITLDRLVRDARARLKQLHGMWRTAPDQLCADSEVMAQPNAARCWNGFDVARYLVRPAGEGLAAGASNPEVRLHPAVAAEQRQTVFNLTEQLKLITSRIKDAMQGIDVDWLVLDVGRRDESAKPDDSSRLLLDGSDMDGNEDGDTEAGSGSSSSSSRGGVSKTPPAAGRVGRPSTSRSGVDGSGGGGGSSDEDTAAGPEWWTAGSSVRLAPSADGDGGSGQGRPPPLPTQHLSGGGDDDEDNGSGSGDGHTGGTGGGGSRRRQPDPSGSEASPGKGPAADMPRSQHQPEHATAASGSGSGSTVVTSERRTSQGNHRAAARSGSSSQATAAAGPLATACAAAAMLLLSLLLLPMPI